MATLGEVGPGSFDAYEGIRILIPGFVVFAVAVITYATLAPDEGIGFLTNPVVGLVGSLVAGLLLYFWDIPARAASYLDNQPTDFLEKRYPDMSGAVLLTTYFAALNEEMPANVRNRALYMGSMYRIAMEMIISLGLGASVVFGVALFNYGGTGRANVATARRIAAAVLAASLVGSILVSRGYDKKNAERTRSPLGAWKTIFAGDLRHWSIWIYLIGIVLLASPSLRVFIVRVPEPGNVSVWIGHVPEFVARVVAGAGLALCEAYWLLRYVRGDSVDPARPRKRRKLRSPTAGLLFALPLVISLAIYEPPDRTVLPTVGHLVGWTAVAVLVIVSVVIRGHERKLHGVYQGQIRWLEKNPERMRSMLPSAGLSDSGVGGQDEAVAAPPTIVEVRATITGMEVLERPSRRRGIRRLFQR